MASGRKEEKVADILRVVEIVGERRRSKKGATGKSGWLAGDMKTAKKVEQCGSSTENRLGVAGIWKKAE